MSTDVYTDTYSDTYGGSGSLGPAWRFVAGNGVTLLYPYLLLSGGVLLPLFVTSAGTDTGTNISAIVGDLGTVQINWTLVSGSTGYLVGRDGGDGQSITAGAGATSYLFDSLVNGQQYTFSVRPLPSGALKTITVTAVNTSTPPPDDNLGFGVGAFGSQPFGA